MGTNDMVTPVFVLVFVCICYPLHLLFFLH